VCPEYRGEQGGFMRGFGNDDSSFARN